MDSHLLHGDDRAGINSSSLYVKGCQYLLHGWMMAKVLFLLVLAKNHVEQRAITLLTLHQHQSPLLQGLCNTLSSSVLTNTNLFPRSHLIFHGSKVTGWPTRTHMTIFTHGTYVELSLVDIITNIWGQKYRCLVFLACWMTLKKSFSFSLVSFHYLICNKTLSGFLPSFLSFFFFLDKSFLTES